MSTFAFSDFLKKAHGALANLRGGNVFAGKNGEVLFSKNNVCVHEAAPPEGELDLEEDVIHTPGYLTIHCQSDEQLGVTLILQWLSNSTLEKNPASIRCVSPRGRGKAVTPIPNSSSREKPKYGDESDEEVGENRRNSSTVTSATTAVITNNIDSSVSTQVVVEEVAGAVASPERPNTLATMPSEGGLGIPSIKLIPHTPVEHAPTTPTCDSDSTSGADELSDKENGADSSSSCDEDNGEVGVGARSGAGEEDEDAGLNHDLEEYSRKCEALLSTIPEQFAKEHNLMFSCDSQPDDASGGGGGGAGAKDPSALQQQQQRPSNTSSLFTVNLGKMRSMRIFYSGSDCSSGQLVIATLDSRYKILHFHCGGLDKLASLFEQWNAVKAKSLQSGSPSPIADRHFLTFNHHELAREELDPEEGIYERVNYEFWRSCKNADGSIDDALTIRKAVFFASISDPLRRELWPFLLRVYPLTSTLEQREAIRNDLFIRYQAIKRAMMRKLSSAASGKGNFASVESSIVKDVIRTDRRSDFFAGDDNPNLQVMRSVLLNYASSHPHIGYIQGMSDLLSPLLSTLRDETLAYWCLCGLMDDHSLFRTASNGERSMMELNLEYLRQLLRLLVPDFYRHLEMIGGEAMQLMFVHRWLVLFFKREFPDSMKIWEACWTRYRTAHFHLFVATAIVSIYGSDVVAQALPNDELLLYFSSLTGHMDIGMVMRKARGLLHKLYRLPKLPCTLAGLLEMDSGSTQWSSHLTQKQHIIFECTQQHPDGEQCPFATGP